MFILPNPPGTTRFQRRWISVTRRDSCDFGADTLSVVTYGGDAPPVHLNSRANCCSIVFADSGALPDYRLCLIVPETITCQREQCCLHGALDSAIKRLISHTHTNRSFCSRQAVSSSVLVSIQLGTHVSTYSTHTRLVAQSAFVYVRVKGCTNGSLFHFRNVLIRYSR